MPEVEFGGRLKELREAAGKSRAVLAKDAAVTYAYVRQLETGERQMPGGSKLAALASALGVSADALLGTSGAAVPIVMAARDERADVVTSINLLLARLDLRSLHAVREVIEGFVRLGSSARTPERSTTG